MEYCDKAHEAFDGLILSCADAQLLLNLAFGVSLNSELQCSVSTYHYFVALHMVVVGMLTTAFAILLVRTVYKSYVFSTLARIVVLAVCLTILTESNADFTETLSPLPTIHETRALLSTIHEKLPADDQKDSLIVLTAYCIFEAAVNPIFNLTQEQEEYLTKSGLHRNIRHQSRTIAGMFIFAAMGISLGPFFSRKHSTKEAHQALDERTLRFRRRFQYSMFIAVPCVKGFIGGVCLGLIIWNWITISILRSWVDKSDWLNREGGNPENDIQGIGQTAPLVALGAVGYTYLDGVWMMARKSHLFRRFRYDDNPNASRRSSIALQPLVEGTPAS